MKTHHLLDGKKGIIFGALDKHSIAWKVAEECHKQGAKLVLSNAPVAVRMGGIKDLSKICNKAPVIAADVTKTEDIDNLFSETMNHFGGGVDFILHSVGMSLNIRKSRPYTELNYDFMNKTLDISSISLHKILQSAYKADAINEWGSVVALTYIAAQRIFPYYSEMADAKALLESIARSFGYHMGTKKKIRINTVSQSPTRTTAGSGIKGFEGFIKYAEKMSPLGNAGAEDCAKYCCSLFSDYTRMITMQNLFHDGGFSSMGVNTEIGDMFE